MDPKVPIENNLRALVEARDKGEIGGIQLSEAGADTIRRADAVAGKIELVEEEISLWTTHVFENGISAVCAELDIPLLAHTPLGSGMLTGNIKTVDDLPAPYLKFFPRFQGANFQRNLDLVAEIQTLAKSKGVTAAQLALSWLKHQGTKTGSPRIIPI